MNDHDEGDDEATAQIKTRLAELRQAHGDLGAAVNALLDQHSPDMILIARMKKRKLALRDQIVLLENQLISDIIA